MQGLLEFPHFTELITFLQGHEVHLVGGTIRDLFLERPIVDLDLIIPRHCLKTARVLIKRLGIPGFSLHDEMGVFRAIPGPGYTIDFTARQGHDLEADLFNRDFTFNAMAVPLDELAGIGTLSGLSEHLIDPTGGYVDLGNRYLRVIRPDAFVNDPLRMLRLFRFMVELGCEVEPRTLELVRLNNHRLSHGVSRERIQHELFRILHGNLARGMRPMVQTGLWRSLMSGLGADVPSDDRQFIDTCEMLNENTRVLMEKLAETSSEWLMKYFKTSVSGGTTLRSLFQFLHMLPDDERGQIMRIGRELTLSNAALKILQSWRSSRKMLAELAGSPAEIDTRTLRFLLFRYKEHAIAGSLSFLLISTIVSGTVPIDAAETIDRLVSEWTMPNPERTELLNRINGQYVMALSGLQPGKQLGDIITTVRAGVYTGELSSADDIRMKVEELCRKD